MFHYIVSMTVGIAHNMGKRDMKDVYCCVGLARN